VRGNTLILLSFLEEGSRNSELANNIAVVILIKVALRLSSQIWTD
jgi:hypothetical protein